MGTYQWKPFTLLVSAEEVKGNEMKIEAGKYYKTRDGRKVGPMRELDRKNTDYPWTDQYGDLPDQRYSDSGKEIGMGSDYYLISEWQDEPSPIRTVTRREIVAGVYGCVEVDNVNSDGVSLWLPRNKRWSSEELREAAHILNQIAEVLQENGE